LLRHFVPRNDLKKNIKEEAVSKGEFHHRGKEAQGYNTQIIKSLCLCVSVVKKTIVF